MRQLIVSVLTAVAAVGLGAQTPRPAPAAPAAEPDLRLTAVVPARQLAVRIGALEAAAAPGGRATLVVAIVPQPRMHVYAPGEPDYIPIALKLDTSPAFTTGTTNYPAAEQIFLPAISQRVRAYGSPFRITQPITVAGTAAVQRLVRDKQPLTISGTLSYQACDDRLCYKPESVPLIWKIPIAVAGAGRARP